MAELTSYLLRNGHPGWAVLTSHLTYGSLSLGRMIITDMKKQIHYNEALGIIFCRHICVYGNKVLFFSISMCVSTSLYFSMFPCSLILEFLPLDMFYGTVAFVIKLKEPEFEYYVDRILK